ncbi:GNAT family N-acetyltransferase [Burkholderia sp. WSM2232]|uniref:GNAT family N-acetyltransferase n=1 Tax=Burkholderia sp. WSM2232 TaxID=944436 RepID=UPI00040F6961|nr:GNAT family N-acetyltransferase [Burkholderia sp. WSM2232]
MTEPQQTAAATLAALDWRWKAFDDLTSAEVYAMLAARSAVFVIEQNCLYGDIDGLDVDAWHLLAFGPSAGASPQAATGAQRAPLAGYLRVLLPDADDADVRIGRVLTTAAFRGIGLGHAMLERAIAQICEQWPGTPIRLHAQAHLQRFYGAFGFEPVSEIHEEDGIPHVWMRSA